MSDVLVYYSSIIIGDHPCAAAPRNIGAPLLVFMGLLLVVFEAKRRVVGLGLHCKDLKWVNTGVECLMSSPAVQVIE